MIEESAIVVDVGPKGIWVETQRKSACSSCAVNKGCGTSVLSRVVGNRSNRVRVVSPIEVSVGESVVIGINESALVRGSFAVYLVPLLFMFVLALAGEWLAQEYLWDKSIITMLGGLIGLGIGFLWLKRYSHRIRNDSRFQPVILHKQNEVSFS
jgi:sigma-E factor negative regulatory protein RseC